jgi:signal transduction histidine kinase/CheY-like chemotaxis protein
MVNRPSSPPDGPPADLQQVVALGERLAGASDEPALAEIATLATPALLGASVVAWLTDRHERCEPSHWDETSCLVLRRAALAELPRAGRAVVLAGDARPPALAQALGSAVLVIAPLRTQRDVVGVLACAVPDADTRVQALLAMLAHQASASLAGLRLADLLKNEARALEAQLDKRTRELRRAEQQIIVSDRLATLGTLVAGIGHEITNPLATVMLNNGALVNRLARAGLPAGLLTEAQRLVAENDEALERIRGLVAELRTFARKDDGIPHALDLRPVIDSSLRLCRAHLRHVDLSIDLPTLPAVRGSSSRLGQVFLNLLVNAAQAVVGSTHPRISVRAEVRDDKVRVGVTDNGPGVPEAVRERIFDMFFTTKAPQDGTGLGLAIARDIVERHGGRISVESRPGDGATFWVELPVLTGEAATQRPRTPSSPAIKPARRKPSIPQLAVRPPRPRLLIIDDEVMILRALERELEADFEITTAKTGDDAVAATSTSQFDVVLCDVNLAGENGHDVIQRLERGAGGLAARTVFMSGGPVDTKARTTSNPGRFVAKPFQMPALIEMLRSVMASAGTAK